MPSISRRVAANRRCRVGFALAGLAGPLAMVPAFVKAATESSEITLEEVVVTATRRTESVQDVPLNITALSGDTLESQGSSNLSDLMRDVPGFFVVQQGARTSNRVVARGLNATPISSPEGIGNDAGGTVSTYLGEIPLYVDLNVVDLERVEVLLGPQGTLYGAGTMGGAVRYLPQRPQLGETTLSVRGSAYDLAHSSSIGTNINAVLNLPLGETFAARAVLGYTDDPGFIDYGYVVREGGVSDPEPDFGDPADVEANLRRVKDADDAQTLSARAALRWNPSEVLDANLTYYYQKLEAGGRTVNSVDAFGTDRYTSGLRYLEPSDRENQLLALEIEADLGFATLTSATGASRYDEVGQRDQTDLLITLDYGYETFPAFSAFTLEEQEDETFTQELRLVSNTDGPLQWIVGGFYNKLESTGSSKEFTPGFADYNGFSRPDALEYYSLSIQDLQETALFGEVSWNVTDRWQVTVGGRRYEYDLDIETGFDLPLLNTWLGDYGPDEINLELSPDGQKDEGTLWKFNTSFDFTEDVLGYFTLSEGYRIGSANGVPACTEDDLNSPGQAVCGLPDEVQYFPDKTVNYEVGLRTQWMDGRVTANGAVYYIDWKDPQLNGSTVNGALPITRNGEGARSQGFEVNASAWLTPQIRVWGNYAYTDAELTKLAPALIATIEPDSFGRVTVDGEKGDRLPGSPKHQGSLNLRFESVLSNGWEAGFTYGISAVSNVLTRTGNKGDGEALGGYGVNYASLDVTDGPLSVTLYADNLFDKYAETGVRGNSAYLRTASDADGAPVRVRTYYKDVLRPLEIGLRFRYDFAF